MSARDPESVLAPYAMRAASSRGRRHAEPEHAYRTAFQRDRDRIIHATAFRRLEYKTQVFVNHEGDHYRTRLTHTLEVSQIARSLARALGANEDLTEAVALAHDLGHTPFGHTGEGALNELMRGQGGFEHNAQGLRVVDLLERRYPGFRGLNLTYEVREAFARHSTRHDFPRGAGTEFPPDEAATVEAQAVVVADEIAYDNHDLDDGLASGILHVEEVRALALWRHVESRARLDPGALPPRVYTAQMIRHLIDFLVTDVIDESRRRLAAAGVQSAGEVRSVPGPLVAPSAEATGLKDELERFLQAKFYSCYTVTRMARKARQFLREMFEAYLAEPGMLPFDARAEAAGEPEGLPRVVCDYLAGMTDRFAQQEYGRLFYTFERT